MSLFSEDELADLADELDDMVDESVRRFRPALRRQLHRNIFEQAVHDEVADAQAALVARRRRDLRQHRERQVQAVADTLVMQHEGRGGVLQSPGAGGWFAAADAKRPEPLVRDADSLRTVREPHHASPAQRWRRGQRVQLTQAVGQRRPPVASGSWEFAVQAAGGGGGALAPSVAVFGRPIRDGSVPAIEGLRPSYDPSGDDGQASTGGRRRQAQTQVRSSSSSSSTAPSSVLHAILTPWTPPIRRGRVPAHMLPPTATSPYRGPAPAPAGGVFDSLLAASQKLDRDQRVNTTEHRRLLERRTRQLRDQAAAERWRRRRQETSPSSAAASSRRPAPLARSQSGLRLADAAERSTSRPDSATSAASLPVAAAAAVCHRHSPWLAAVQVDPRLLVPADERDDEEDDGPVDPRRRGRRPRRLGQVCSGIGVRLLNLKSTSSSSGGAAVDRGRHPRHRRQQQQQ